MFCPHCGTRNPDGANFCQGYGKSLSGVFQGVGQQTPVQGTPEQEPPKENFYQSPPPVTNPDPTVNYYTATSNTSSPLDALRSIASSKLFAFTASAFCATILLKILSMMDTSFMWRVITQILGDVDRSLLSDVSPYLRGMSSISAIFSQIPLILVAVGLWVTYATATKKGERFNTAGLTIIKVLYIIELVAMCVALALCMIVMLVATFTATDSEAAMYVFAVVIALDIVFGVIIFWFAMVLRCVNVAKTAAREESGKHIGKNASAFVGVICYICGGFSILAALVNLVTLSIVSFCSNAVGAAVQICFGILIFKFRGEMNKLK
ncbi:MAG: zinc ribbon domain-containing protein [Oscillospiraceae bacterium]|nr:zinc ribbon domain-containing protein [Oscillospiraceae bacterium]